MVCVGSVLVELCFVVGLGGCVFVCYNPGYVVSVPERSKGVDSSSTVFALVGSNPTADTTFCIFLLHNTHNTHAHTPHAHTHTSTTTTTALLTLHPTTLHHPRHTHTRPPDPQRASVTHSHAREFWPLLTTISNPTPSTDTHIELWLRSHSPSPAQCLLRLASGVLPPASCLLPPAASVPHAWANRGVPQCVL